MVIIRVEDDDVKILPKIPTDKLSRVYKFPLNKTLRVDLDLGTVEGLKSVIPKKKGFMSKLLKKEDPETVTSLDKVYIHGQVVEDYPAIYVTISDSLEKLKESIQKVDDEDIMEDYMEVRNKNNKKVQNGGSWSKRGGYLYRKKGGMNIIKLTKMNLSLDGVNRLLKKLGLKRGGSLPKDIENIVMKYKKEMEKNDKNTIRRINDLYDRWEELDNVEDKDEDIEDEIDNIYMEMEELVKEYLRNGGDFKKIHPSNIWKESDFISKNKKGGKNMKEMMISKLKNIARLSKSTANEGFKQLNKMSKSALKLFKGGSMNELKKVVKKMGTQIMSMKKKYIGGNYCGGSQHKNCKYCKKGGSSCQRGGTSPLLALKAANMGKMLLTADNINKAINGVNKIKSMGEEAMKMKDEVEKSFKEQNGGSINIENSMKYIIKTSSKGFEKINKLAKDGLKYFKGGNMKGFKKSVKDMRKEMKKY